MKAQVYEECIMVIPSESRVFVAVVEPTGRGPWNYFWGYPMATTVQNLRSC